MEEAKAIREVALVPAGLSVPGGPVDAFGGFVLHSVLELSAELPREHRFKHAVAARGLADLIVRGDEVQAVPRGNPAFHLSKLGRFLGLLKSTAEGDGSMLDRTITLFGSGMNSGAGGEHSPKNLPLVVAGGAKLGVKLGRHIAYHPDKHPPLANVLLSLVQKTGVPTTKFADSTGTLAELVG